MGRGRAGYSRGAAVCASADDRGQWGGGGRVPFLIDASCSKGDALALLDVRLREYTEKGLDGHNLEKLRDYVAETY